MSRLDRLRALLPEHHIDAILIQNAETRTYLTGFTGSAGAALVTARESLLLVDFRYVEQAAAEAPGREIVKVPRQAPEIVTEMVRGRELRRLGFESDGMTYRQYDELGTALRPAERVPATGVDRLRWGQGGSRRGLAAPQGDLCPRARCAACRAGGHPPGRRGQGRRRTGAPRDHRGRAWRPLRARSGPWRRAGDPRGADAISAGGRHAG